MEPPLSDKYFSLENRTQKEEALDSIFAGTNLSPPSNLIIKAAGLELK